jgi:hypothetical protein
MKNNIINMVNKSCLVNFLVAVFLIHGALYFIYPESIYSLTSKIKLVKYIVLLVLYIVVIKDMKFTSVLPLLVTYSCLAVLSLASTGHSFNFVELFSYLIPMSLMFFYGSIMKYLNVRRIVLWTYLIMTIFAYVEFFVLNGLFFRFAKSGYRITSIFVNPNNLGILLVLLSLFVYIYYNRACFILGFIFILNSLFISFLSGSRSSLMVSLLIISVYFFCKAIKICNGAKFKRTTTCYLLIVICLAQAWLITYYGYLIDIIAYLLRNTRKIGNMELFNGRSSQYSNFLSNVNNNILFPSTSNLVYTDNVYLTIWGMFGLCGLFLFCVFNVFLCYVAIKCKEYHKLGMLLVFCVFGISLNFIYLWPTAYIYWLLVASILKNINTNYIASKRIIYLN